MIVSSEAMSPKNDAAEIWAWTLLKSNGLIPRTLSTVNEKLSRLPTASRGSSSGGSLSLVSDRERLRREAMPNPDVSGERERVIRTEPIASVV
jgi:hypothetical protein